MSIPKPSLLLPATRLALESAAFPPDIVAFFGTVSGMALALNNSSNPVAAANTMMKNPDDVKPGRKKSFSQMYAEFRDRKRKYAASQQCELPEELEQLREAQNREDRHEARRQGYSPASTNNDFEPEVFHEGHSQPDNWSDE